MSDNSAGSYAFGTFDENQDELARLKQQAAIVSEMEGRVLRPRHREDEHHHRVHHG